MNLDNLVYWVFLSELKVNTVQKNNIIIDILHSKKMTFKDFFQLSIGDKKNIFNLNEDTLYMLESAKSQLASYAFKIEDIYKQGIEILTLTDTDYPQLLKKNLKKNSPPILYVKGEKKLLNENIAAVVGSRDVSEIGAKFTQNIVKKCINEGMVISSGYARGVDKISHNEAINIGGKIIAIIPQGILTFKNDLKKLYPHIMEGKAIVVSTFSPNDKWAVGRAMERNKYIYGIAQKIYIAESQDKGGTWSGAIEGLKAKQDIYVRKSDDVENCANNKLIQMGAKAVDLNGTLIEYTHDELSDKFNDIVKVLESRCESAENIVKIFNLHIDAYKLIQKLKRTSNINAMIKDNELLFYVNKANNQNQISFF
jgi:DNA processing protein